MCNLRLMERATKLHTGVTMTPTLYKKTKTGAIQQYSVTVTDNIITVTQGQLNGKLQSYHTTCYGKNIGKANETTPAQQAEFEAQSKWNAKLKSGYSLSIECDTETLLPQKVKPYQENKHLVKFPCISTPKLNGVNGTYWLKDDTLTLTSRGGDAFPQIPHLEDGIKSLMKKLNTTCLNGELYIPNTPLEDIISAVKKPKELSNQLMFCIFEAPFLADTYQERNKKLSSIFSTYEYYKVYFLTGVICDTEADIESHYNHCMSRSYEGTVIYNLDAKYLFNHRSSEVLKYKKTNDAEYEIISYSIDKNGHPVFTCITPDQQEFKVKPKGTDSERKAILANFENHYRNKFYKIEYEVLSKKGIPLKPVGIGLRDCDHDGNPKE